MVVVKKHHELYEELRSIVGAKYVSDDLPILLSYTRDMSTFPPGKPQGVVVRPCSVEEVVELVRLANQTRTPLIPIGGGRATLSGAPPGQPGRGIIVDMRRMDKVVEIDEVNMAVTTQCGITLGELTGKVNERGFDVNTGSSSLYPDTVGGQLSGFPGGGFGAYGFSIGCNWHYLLGMKVVLPNGSVIDTGTGEGAINTYRGHTWARAMHGPDLTGMFVADGGIFGIKVEATYRMFRLPKLKRSGYRCWDTLDEAYQALYELWETDPFLYMQPYARAIILGPEFAALIPGAKPAWLLFYLCIGNSEEEIELKARTTEVIVAKHGGRPIEPEVAAHLQSLNTEVGEIGKFATMGRSPWFEVIVPRSDILEACKWTREYVFNALRDRGIDRTRLTILSDLMSVGTGYGLTCLLPFFDANDKELHRAIHEIWLEFLEQARRRGYVIEGTQGHESRLLAKQWAPEFYSYMLTQKKTLDPNNIMNPGVFFP